MQYATSNYGKNSSDTGSPNDVLLSSPHSQPSKGGARFRCPCRDQLTMLGRTTVGKLIGHPLTKGITGVLGGIEIWTDLLRDNGTYIVFGALGLWLISTTLSASCKPGQENIVKHLAQSIGYGVAGLPLGVLYLAVKLIDPEALVQYQDQDTLVQQVFAPVDRLDSPVKGIEGQAPVTYSPYIERFGS